MGAPQIVDAWSLVCFSPDKIVGGVHFTIAVVISWERRGELHEVRIKRVEVWQREKELAVGYVEVRIDHGDRSKGSGQARVDDPFGEHVNLSVLDQVGDAAEIF